MAKTLVRIALAINPEGQWHAYGYKDARGWDEIMDSFDPLDGENKRWIVAEVEIPDAAIPEVAATAEAAE